MSQVVVGRDDLLEEVIQIYYNPSTNDFTDECGYGIFNIYRILSPNVVYLLKYNKNDMFVYGKNGEYIELIYEDYNIDFVYGDSELPIDRY